MSQHYRVTLREAIAHYQNGDLTAKGLLHFYLKIRLKDGWVLKESPKEIYTKLGISRAAFYKAIAKLVEEGSLDPSFYGLDSNKNYVESQIRDRLKSQLGGLAEVKTPAGRIDLLTETEIIEVKRIGEWKSALGQILVYSGFYPEHKRRLHLFGRESDEKQIPTIANSCLAFDVSVSFEMVGVEA